jgi:GNAT superfamily N-acetyltransferase
MFRVKGRKRGMLTENLREHGREIEISKPDIRIVERTDNDFVDCIKLGIMQENEERKFDPYFYTNTNFTDSNALNFLWYLDGTVVGYLRFLHIDEYWLVTHFFVLPSYRHFGSFMFVKEVLKKFFSEGIVLRYNYSIHNRAMIGFSRRYGATKVYDVMEIDVGSILAR